MRLLIFYTHYLFPPNISEGTHELVWQWAKETLLQALSVCEQNKPEIVIARVYYKEKKIVSYIFPENSKPVGCVYRKEQFRVMSRVHDICKETMNGYKSRKLGKRESESRI